MNYILLATDIVRRVQHSPDSAHNLADMVANLIREERKRVDLIEFENWAKKVKMDLENRPEATQAPGRPQ